MCPTLGDPRKTPSCKRIPLYLGATLVAGVMLVTPALAHLSMIRQGFETGGGHENGDQHGAAVAAGDFNGDGFDDLAMGAPSEALGSLVYAGAVSVNYGSPNGVTHLGAITYTAANMGGAQTAGASVGWSLASADFDGDGYDDLAIGAPFETVGAAVSAGRVYVMRGSQNGLLSWINWIQTNVGGLQETSDWFGFSLATGHLNGDTHPDLIMGSPGENSFQGTVHYALGTSSGPFGTGGSVSMSDAGGAANTGDYLGWSVATGNVMGGPEEEIITGAPGYPAITTQGPAQYGVILVTPGGPTVPAVSITDLYPPVSPQAGARFGHSVAAGRVRSGTYEAVVIGEPDRDVSGIVGAGRVLVYAGGAKGLSGTFEQLYSSSAGGVLDTNGSFGEAVAVGYFWDPSDGYEDLAVGSPDAALQTGVAGLGQVQIMNGGPAGPSGGYGWLGFNQSTLNEAPEQYDRLGASLAFGFFDADGFGNLAVGAPGEDVAAGMTHVIAPWRQAYGLSCKRSIVMDCDNEIYFSQKPFDQVLIASTTKIMTVAIAAQAATVYLDPPLDTVYTVPAWVETDIPGSQVPLFEGETVTFQDLMYMCLLRSGNDAAFAIADLMQGSTGPDDAVQIFINRMNAQAEILGMDNTHFTNPAGLDQEPVGPDNGDHYSTAYDMAILSEWAMGIPLFRQIAGTTNWPLVRHFPQFDIFWNCGNIFAGVLGNNIEPLTGIKGGYTTNALTTGCFSADGVLGRTIAGSYTTPDPPMNYGPDAGRLIQLGLGACGIFYEPLDDWDNEPGPIGTGGISSTNGVRHGSSTGISGSWRDDVELSVYRTSWDTGAASNLDVTITHVAPLRGKTFYDVGARFIDGHEPMKITNVGSDATLLQVTLPYGAVDYDVDPGETIFVPEYDGSHGDFLVRIASLDEQVLEVDVELPYVHQVTSPVSETGGPIYQTMIIRDASITDDGIEIRTLGHDGVGSTHSIVGHAPDEVVAVPGEGSEAPIDDAPLVRLRAPRPNPFRSITRIEFDLAAAGDVAVEVYDIGGRLVRAYEAQTMPAGSWGLRWDGRTDAGGETATGTYVYRVLVDGVAAASGKLTRIR